MQYREFILNFILHGYTKEKLQKKKQIKQTPLVVFMLLFKIILDKHNYIKLHLNVRTFRFKDGRIVNFEDSAIIPFSSVLLRFNLHNQKWTSILGSNAELMRAYSPLNCVIAQAHSCVIEGYRYAQYNLLKWISE